MKDNIREVGDLAMKTAVRACVCCYGHLISHQFEAAKECMGMYIECCWTLVHFGVCSDFEEAEREVAKRAPEGFHRFIAKNLAVKMPGVPA